MTTKDSIFTFLGNFIPSVLEALDLILDGAQNLVVPAQPFAGRSSTTAVAGHRRYCWLTHEDFVRYFLNSIAVFSPVATLSIDAAASSAPPPPSPSATTSPDSPSSLSSAALSLRTGRGRRCHRRRPTAGRDLPLGSFCLRPHGRDLGCRRRNPHDRLPHWPLSTTMARHRSPSSAQLEQD
ncbi:hypothetical protein C4D60_Mb02t19280 [Musa balbisiana]|uniref:Uncharacterized protein n=1 Tax=Musa balbisiana TaxID=52838 RepID=A0A4S8IBX4_MUSBA|nr:hypothetical protein C4D60_Mb02t19280 [Musa balbisiana]